MRKRDLGILILCAFAVFFSLQHEGGFSFQAAWYHPLDESYPIKHEAERLPPPIVTDLNGDGRKEILVATHDAKIQILEPAYNKGDDNFVEARLKAEVSLLPERVRVTAGRRPVAMATGVVTRHLRPGESSKEVLVVVTASWSILCFDHNLQKLWEADVREDFPHAAHHKEVSILVTNYTLRHSDSGLVIVGGSMEVQPQLHLDPFEEEIVAEVEEAKHRRVAKDSEELEDISAGKAWDRIRHFSYYAFAGSTGQERWRHRSEDFHTKPNIDQVVPQHNYKLDASALNSRHSMEVECRHFRESILGVMPHRWDRREDTRFELSHFRKHKRKMLKKQTGKEHAHPSHKPEEKHVPGKDLTNKVVAGIGKATDFAMATKSGRKNMYVGIITNHTSYWWMPNVVVAHTSRGIEAVHLASGRTVCKLPLPQGGLHADINGDGVLDHVQAFGGSGAERMVPTGMMEPVKPCWAIATSGVPVRESLFNGSICRHSVSSVFQGGEYSRAWGRTANTAPLEVATPVLIPRKDGHRHRKGSFGDVIFLTSRGEIVTGASWANHHTPAGMAVDKVVPTLAALPLRAKAEPEAILAVGELDGVVLHPDGTRLTSFTLPGAPSAPVVIADFSSDGMNDLIVVTSAGIFGYVQARHPGAVLFSSLVGLLIVVMAVIGIMQHLNSPKSKPRAPDR